MAFIQFVPSFENKLKDGSISNSANKNQQGYLPTEHNLFELCLAIPIVNTCTHCEYLLCHKELKGMLTTSSLVEI
jgi:hypothetical protein